MANTIIPVAVVGRGSDDDDLADCPSWKVLYVYHRTVALLEHTRIE